MGVTQDVGGYSDDEGQNVIENNDKEEDHGDEDRSTYI